MPQKTRLGKCAGERGSGGEGSGNGGMLEYIAWDRTLVDAEYLEELVKTNLSVRVQHQRRFGWRTAGF